MAEALDWVSPIIGAGTSIFNAISTAVTNRKNREFQESQNQITRDREDTAHQREVADLQAAGLSPIANMGGASTSTPLASEAEAPQIDMSSVMDALALNEQRREFDADLEERKAARLQDASQREKDRQNQMDIQKSNEEIAKDNRESAEKIANKQIKKEIDIYNKNQENLNTDIERAIEETNNENLLAVQESSEESYRNFCQTFGFIPSKEYTDLTEYQKAKTESAQTIKSFISHLTSGDENQLKDPFSSESQSGGSNATTSGGVLSIEASSTVGSNYSNSFTKETNFERMYNVQHAYKKWKEKENDALLEYPVFKATKTTTKKKYKDIEGY